MLLPDANETALRKHEAEEDEAQRFQELVDECFDKVDQEEAVDSWLYTVPGDNQDNANLVAAYKALDYYDREDQKYLELGKLVAAQIDEIRRLLAEDEAGREIHAAKECCCARCDC